MPTLNPDIDSIARITVSRRTHGIVITFQSKAIGEWIKSIAAYKNKRDMFPNSADYWNISDKSGWDKHKAYKIEQNIEDLICLYSWGANKLYIKDNKVPNLAFLKAYGLENGVTFKLTGLYSQKEIDKWVEQAKEQIIRIYKNYISPYDVDFQIIEMKGENPIQHELYK